MSTPTDDLEAMAREWYADNWVRVSDECVAMGTNPAIGVLMAFARSFTHLRGHYTAVLVNAIRMSDEDKSRLVKDLCDRGAAHPKEWAPTVEKIMEVVGPAIHSQYHDDVRARLKTMLP